ncbi:MAG: hypothetical protein LBE12_00550 [Planctomycetaceae bacterium]|jgi:hypothetical protein|nr:hypothetical protein [Planctomycetaceae bacterium]
MKQLTILGFVLFLFSISFLTASELQFEISNIPTSGLLVRSLDLEPVIHLMKIDRKTKFTGSKKTLYTKGATIFHNKNPITMFDSNNGNIGIYDERGNKTNMGSYMSGSGRNTWNGWKQTTKHQSVWLRLDTEEILIDKYFCSKFEQHSFLQIRIIDRTVQTWLDVARNALIYAGIFQTKKDIDSFQVNGERFIAIHSDHLGMLLEKVVTENGHGIRLIALVDIPSLTLLTPPKPQSLFTINIRKEKEDKSGFTMFPLTSDDGWKSVNVISKENKTLLTFCGIPNISGGDQVCLTLLFQARQKTDTEKTDTAWYDRSSISVT